jgi:hypothetical protein
MNAVELANQKALLVARCDLARVEMALAWQEARTAITPPRVEAGSAKRSIAAFVISLAAPFFGVSRVGRFLRGASIVFTVMRFVRAWRAGR